MHILTKVFVILAALLSIALSALTITYAANADRIVNDYKDERARRTAAESQASSQARQYERQVEELRGQLEQAQGTMASREAEVRRLQTENVRLLADKRAAEASRDSIENKIAQLGETGQTQVALIESYRDEVTELRENELRFRREKLELEDRINDLESQREVLDQATRALQEQLAQLQRTVAQGGVAAGVLQGGAAADARPFVMPGVLVQGVVEEVTNDVNGRPIARIDLGSNDNVSENMKLFVVRGDRFLANLVIVRTDLNTAIGQLDTLGQGTTVQPGDRVLSSLR